MKKLYRKLWRANGPDYQLNILIEEMSELTKAILKARRYKKKVTNKMIEELTDVKICAEQLEQYINEPEKMEKMRAFKLKRLKKLINKHN
jgi:NTP pyrophosphatase (non-canonical NTP hydrolase)